LKTSGFENSKFYGTFPHYINPALIIPFDEVKCWKKEIFQDLKSPWSAVSKMFPKNLLKFFSPSFVVISQKPDGPLTGTQYEPRIAQLCRRANLIQQSVSQYKIIKLRGRSGNHHAANYLFCFDNGSPTTYFCKISRNDAYKDIIANEAKNIQIVTQLLKDKEIHANVPVFLFFDTVDNIPFLVTTCLTGKYVPFIPKAHISKMDLKTLDHFMQQAIDFLVKFQKSTQHASVDAVPYLLTTIKKQQEALEKNRISTPEIQSLLIRLIDEITTARKTSLPLCAVHGDYDFYHNILFDGKQVNVVDFEHFEQEGLPFLDLATLLLNPFLISYEKIPNQNSFSEFLKSNNIQNYLTEWVRYYAEQSGISKELLCFFGPLAALEQQTKNYPYYREARTFPMRQEKIFIELLSFRISL
jgi:aminoglycoside phosphotransferase (APT) family kinase protein